jgi:hypothetical protein
MRRYDLAVAYRIYPQVSKTPIVFRDDKYKLAQLCLSSFKKSLGDVKTKVWVLLDNCPIEYEGLFQRYFDADDLEFVRLAGIGNLATFELQLDILLNQTVSESVYFAEDDYFYLPNQFEEMIEFLRENEGVHFVSPNDHLDYYTWDLLSSLTFNWAAVLADELRRISDAPAGRNESQTR